jgi:hypothetical protein
LCTRHQTTPAAIRDGDDGWWWADGGRAEHPWLWLHTAGTWSAKMQRKTALQWHMALFNDTQEIAKSFWSYFYGGLSPS